MARGARRRATAEAEEAIERLIEIGELDDERFARRYAEDKRELRGWGPDRIREALVERGIERAVAEAAAGGERPGRAGRAGGGSSCADAARIFATTRAAAKALAYLARRGYDYEVAYQAVRLAERRSRRRNCALGGVTRPPRDACGTLPDRRTMDRRQNRGLAAASS